VLHMDRPGPPGSKLCRDDLQIEQDINAGRPGIGACRCGTIVTGTSLSAARATTVLVPATDTKCCRIAPCMPRRHRHN